MRWDLGAGDNGALKFIQTRLREALEVARTTRHKEAVYFTELSYLAVSELIRESLAGQELQAGAGTMQHGGRRPSNSRN